MPEYRVTWRREGAQRRSQIFQTRAAAERKVDGMLALDDVKEGTRFADMGNLLEPPLIQERPVGEWEDCAEQLIEPSDDACARMEEWAMPGSQSGVAF